MIDQVRAGLTGLEDEMLAGLTKLQCEALGDALETIRINFTTARTALEVTDG